MTFVSRCVCLLQKIDRGYLSVSPRIELGNALQRLLLERPIVIADVGAAGGLDPRWRDLKPFARFLTFEPRSDSAAAENNFPVALSKEKGRRVLHLTRFPESSSLYPISPELIRDFAAGPQLELIGKTEVEVNTLDALLRDGDRPENLSPDFLKLDVEGAELDVLRGSETALARTILGLKTEVSFSTRHQGAPLFVDVDQHLRQRGFVLFSLSREAMIRRNRRVSPISQPQVVWGDAIYFLSREKFLEKLDKLPSEARGIVAAKFVLLLLAFRLDDYAAEILDLLRSRPDFPSEVFAELETALRVALRSSRFFFRSFAGTFLALSVWLVAWPLPRARKWARLYLKRRAGYLFYYGWRLTAQESEYSASVSDPNF